MERYDVDLEFEPKSAMPDEEQQAWRDIVTKALTDAPGGVTATFVQEGDVWILRAFTWGKAAREGFHVAHNDEVAPWRDAMLQALKKAGKPVRS